MRKFLALLLLILVLTPTVRADEPKYVALTFDDGPSGRFTRRLLDGLEERGAKATFFVCGYRLVQYPELAERMHQQGHELGIHGYSHQDMRSMSRREIAAEIMDTEALLPENAPVKCIRAPGGCCSDGVRQVAEARKLVILSWSAEGNGEVRDGDLILLRDSTAAGVRQALTLADRLLEEGYELVSVSELANLRNVNLKPGRTYDCFPPATVAENPIS